MKGLAEGPPYNDFCCVHSHSSQRHPLLRTVIGPEGMKVGDPRPMHKHFHTILGFMDAHDPLLSWEPHGRNRLLRELALNTFILSHCLGAINLMALFAFLFRSGTLLVDFFTYVYHKLNGAICVFV